MGTYLGVNAVKRIGKLVTLIFPGQRPEVPNDSFLIAIICNGLYAIAPEVTDSKEYDYFYQSYAAGNWLTFKVYAVPESERSNCEDEGRQPC